MRTSVGVPILVLAGLLALTYLAGAAFGIFFFATEWEGGLDAVDAEHVFWLLAFIGGFVLLLSGLLVARRSSPWVAAALMSVGAVAGAVPIYWTIAAPVAAIALVAFSVAWARRSRGAAA